MPRIRRAFTPEFKAKVVLELISGHSSQAELCRQHQLSPSLLSTWKDAVAQRLPLVFQDDVRLGHEQARIAELEQLAGRLALEVDVLKKASRLLAGGPDRNGRPS
jgi:transposase